MSNFSYEKYNEIVSSVNYLGEKLKKEGQDTYTSIKVEEIACQLISVANSLQAYIRHSRNRRR